MKKFQNKKNIFAALIVIVFVALIPIIQSCSNNDVDSSKEIQSSAQLNSSEKNEIINSTEFAEFVNANVELVSALRKIDSITKDLKTLRQIKTGVTPNGVSYRVYPFNIDQSLQKAVLLKSAALQKKYPEFKSFNYGNIKDLMKDAIVKSAPIKKIFCSKGVFAMKKQNVRQKAGQYEGNGMWYYDQAWEGQVYASIYSAGTQNESSGYVLANGTAVVYINPNGQHGEGSYPSPMTYGCVNGTDVSIYKGQNIVETFHVQFNGSNPSATDKNSQSIYYPNCAMVILYNGSAYYYYYNNGAQTK